MTTFDLSPLLRSSVGFDAFDNIFDSVFNLNESSGAYPPYNIVCLLYTSPSPRD